MLVALPAPDPGRSGTGLDPSPSHASPPRRGLDARRLAPGTPPTCTGDPDLAAQGMDADAARTRAVELLTLVHTPDELARTPPRVLSWARSSACLASSPLIHDQGPALLDRAGCRYGHPAFASARRLVRVRCATWPRTAPRSVSSHIPRRWRRWSTASSSCPAEGPSLHQPGPAPSSGEAGSSTVPPPAQCRCADLVDAGPWTPGAWARGWFAAQLPVTPEEDGTACFPVADDAAASAWCCARPSRPGEVVSPSAPLSGTLEETYLALGRRAPMT